MKCKFCAFAATQKQEKAYTSTLRRTRRGRGAERETIGFTEIHMVNGENPHVGFDFYVDTIAQAARALPDVHLKCYTASEIHHMTTLSGLTHEQVLRELQDAGLGSLPGGGAEIFAERVRAHRRAGQGVGRRSGSTCTTRRTGSAFRRTARCSTATSRPTRSASSTCCACATSRTRPAASSRSSRSRSIPENTVFERRGFKFQTGAEDLKMLAVSRLLLDNIEHMKAYWISMDDAGRAGRAALRRERRPGHARPRGDLPRRRLDHGTEQKLDELARVVRAAGRIPVQRDTLYNELRRWDG